jgi:HEPN domain-containing protein
MSKQEHIAYWKKEAENNFQTALILIREKQYVMALFMFNLMVEKLLKGHWVKDNTDHFPPRTHDLQAIHNQTEVNLPTAQYDYLAIVTRWNIDARYPDYKNKIYAIATSVYLAEQEVKVKELKTCLLETL